MSLRDLDTVSGKRLTEAEDMNTDGAINLVTEIMDSAAEALRFAVIHAANNPHEGARKHLMDCMRFYTSDLFAAYSMGMADGKIVMRKIIRQTMHDLRRKGGRNEDRFCDSGPVSTRMAADPSADGGRQLPGDRVGGR